MQFLFIDESGSMTVQHANNEPYFVIAVVCTDNPQKLRILHKRFVRQNIEGLKAADSAGRMFDRDGQFAELKGSMFTPKLKRKFVSFFLSGKHT